MTAPIVAALVARPRLAPTGQLPAHRRTGKVRLRAGLLAVVVCGLTGLRVGWRWPLPAFVVFSAGLATLGLCDRYWRVLPNPTMTPFGASSLSQQSLPLSTWLTARSPRRWAVVSGLRPERGSGRLGLVRPVKRVGDAGAAHDTTATSRSVSRLGSW